MNTLTLYVRLGAPCPSWPTPPCANSDMQIRCGRPRPPHANSEKQKNERTNPIPPNSNPAILVQRNFASIPRAVDVKLPSISRAGTNPFLPAPTRIIWRRERVSAAVPNEKQKNERTNPIPPNPNPTMLVHRNFASILCAVDLKPPSIRRSLHPGSVLSRAAGLRWVNIYPKRIQSICVGANGYSPVCAGGGGDRRGMCAISKACMFIVAMTLPWKINPNELAIQNAGS